MLSIVLVSGAIGFAVAFVLLKLIRIFAISKIAMVLILCSGLNFGAALNADANDFIRIANLFYGVVVAYIAKCCIQKCEQKNNTIDTNQLLKNVTFKANALELENQVLREMRVQFYEHMNNCH